MGLFNKGFKNLRNNGYWANSGKILKFKLFLSGILLIGIILLLFNSNTLRIKKAEVYMNGIDCTNEIQLIELLEFKNQNIFLYNSANISKKILDKFYCIRQVKIEKRLFDKIKVTLESRMPSAIINTWTFSKKTENLDLPTATSSSQEAVNYLSQFDFNDATRSGKFLSDLNGFIYSEAKGDFKNLPSIDLVNFEVNLGKKIPGNLINTVITILDELKENSIAAENVKILETKILIYSEPKLIFSTEKQIARQVASLQLILQKARIDSRPIESIDLRFDKPVVKYSPKK